MGCTSNNEKVFDKAEQLAKNVLEAEEAYKKLIKDKEELCEEAGKYAVMFQERVDKLKKQIQEASDVLTEASITYNNYYDEHVDFFEEFDNEDIVDESSVTVVDEDGASRCELSAYWEGEVSLERWTSLLDRIYEHLKRYN